jgi:hypothetical protein
MSLGPALIWIVAEGLADATELARKDYIAAGLSNSLNI